MNQSEANLRRSASVVAAFALISGLWLSSARAQSAPADSSAAPADTTATPVSAGKPAKSPKPAKPRTPTKPYEDRRKEDGVLAQGANWLSLRFGYAKRSGDLSGQGFVGYGVGYQHMMSNRYAFAAGVGHDVVGHFANQVDIAVPFTAEFQRHFRWKSAARPYVGVGGGFYFRKKYRTGGEYNTYTTGGAHVTVGFHSAIDDRHVIGIEARAARLQGQSGIVNPTFGTGEDSETLWSLKASWSLVY